MKIAFLAILGVLTGCYAEPSGKTKTATAESTAHFETVTRVVDGDTFVIAAHWSPYNLEWRIRLLGLDTPEKGARAHCQREKKLSMKAMALTNDLLSKSENRIQLRDVKHDKFGGRLDATVILSDGSTLQEHLIEAGVARRYTGDGPKPNWCRP